MGAVGQQPLDDVEIHFMAVPADRLVAVDVPVAVYEVIHVAVVPLAIHDDISKINLSCVGEQCKKFFCYILFSSEMVLMLLPFKKRENFLLYVFMSDYLFISLYFNYQSFS